MRLALMELDRENGVDVGDGLSSADRIVASGPTPRRKKQREEEAAKFEAAGGRGGRGRGRGAQGSSAPSPDGRGQGGEQGSSRRRRRRSQAGAEGAAPAPAANRGRPGPGFRQPAAPSPSPSFRRGARRGLPQRRRARPCGVPRLRRGRPRVRGRGAGGRAGRPVPLAPSPPQVRPRRLPRGVRSRRDLGQARCPLRRRPGLQRRGQGDPPSAGGRRRGPAPRPRRRTAPRVRCGGGAREEAPSPPSLAQAPFRRGGRIRRPRGRRLRGVI